MRKWIAKMLLLTVIALPLGAGARVMADGVIYNSEEHNKYSKNYDPDRCSCLYHVIEGFVIGLFD